MWLYFWTKMTCKNRSWFSILIVFHLSSISNFCIFLKCSAIYLYLCIPHYTTIDLKVAFFSPSKYSLFLLRIFKLWRIGAHSAESWKFQTLVWPIWTDPPLQIVGVSCVRPSLTCLLSLSSGYLPFEIPPGMKINWGQARMRPPAGVPSAAPCALFWVHSAYPWQVMPAADKRPPLPVRCLDWEPGVSIPVDTVTFIEISYFFLKRNCSAAGIEHLRRSI